MRSVGHPHSGVAESLREHTRWRTLVSYWAWILTASVSIGGALRASGQYWPAAGFFSAAGFAAISKSILVAVDAKDDKLWHRISYAVFWSLVAVGVSSAVIWGVYPGSIPVSLVIALGMRQGQQHGL